MKKVLLIQDNQSVAENIADTLIASGYIVCVVFSYDKGQQAMFHYRPDVIVSDTFMPGMSGIEFMQLIRKDPQYQSLPVILLSGGGSGQDWTDRQHAGTNVYVSRSCDADALALSVAKVVNHKTLPI